MKKETTITLTAGETATYERCLKALSYIPVSDIKPIADPNGDKKKYEVSREFMFNVEQLINTVSGEEFNFMD